MITNTSAPQVVDPSPSSLKTIRLEKSVKGDSNFDHAPINKYLWCPRWCTPMLLNGFKCESKLKTTEEQGVGARSLARNTLRGGRGACWNSRMGLGRVTSINYSRRPMQNQHKVVSLYLNHKVEPQTLKFYNIINPNTCIITHCYQKNY
jgi:hypothetical protein